VSENPTRDDTDGDELHDGATLPDDDATAVAAPAARRKSGSIDIAAAFQTPPTRPASESGTQGQALTAEPSLPYPEASTPGEAMLLEEVERTHAFVKIALGIVGAIAVALPFLSGDPTAKKLVAVGLLPAAAASIWLLLKTRDPAKYRIADATMVAIALSAAAYAGVFYWGIFSPAPAVILMGIYFFSLGGNWRATLLVYLFCAGFQVVLAGLILGGAIEDRGIVTADQMQQHEQIITQVIVQVLYLSAFLVARNIRKSTFDALGRLERAVRAVSQREALLAEARQDLDRARRVGGRGRYTDQNIGSYTLGVLIGRGGMGEVYEATHDQTHRPAAVKLLHAQVLANPKHASRFEREIEVAATLDVDNVVRVLEYGRTAGEVPYLAMERLRGRDLAQYLRKRRRLPLDETATMVREIGRGLAAARAAGIVHRDIKPHNLFLAKQSDGTSMWKILDFGVSKLGTRSGTLTKGHVVGTPGYMAPEQAKGKSVDYRADLYALAAIAYRALTGRPPFSRQDVPTTLYDVVYAMPMRPSRVANLPEVVDYVLAVGLAKDSDERFESGEELADALLAAENNEIEAELVARADSLLEENPWA